MNQNYPNLRRSPYRLCSVAFATKLSKVMKLTIMAAHHNLAHLINRKVKFLYRMREKSIEIRGENH